MAVQSPLLSGIDDALQSRPRCFELLFGCLDWLLQVSGPASLPLTF
jgi:hypothetical protein